MKSVNRTNSTGRRRQNDELLMVRIRLMEYALGHGLDELLQYSLDEICAFNGSPMGFYHFVEPDQTTLSLQAWSTGTLKDFCTTLEKGTPYPIGESGIWVDSVHQQKPVMVNHYATIRPRKGEREQQAAILRELVVPVLRTDLVVALLGVGNKSKPYGDEDVRELSFLADVLWSMVAQKRTEQALAESKELFRLFVEQSPVYTYIKDENLRVIEASRNFEKLLGRPLELIIGRRTEELFPPEFAGTIHRGDLDVLAAGGPSEFEYEFKGRHFHSIKFPLKRGNRTFLASQTMDFTERRNAQQALHRSEEHFRAFFENATVGMATTDLDKHFTSVNSALCRMLGYSREELLTLTWPEVTHPDDLPTNFIRFDRTVSGEINDTVCQKRYLKKDGATVHAVNTVKCLRNQDGGVKYFIVLVEDITARVATERELMDIRRQMLQQDKMASIGLLASGIAHEINNPMGFITSNITTLGKYWDRLDSYISALEQELRESSTPQGAARITTRRGELKIDRIRNELPQIIRESADGSGRIKAIISDLKRFARSDEFGRMEPADLNQCIRSVITIVTNEIKYVATLALELGELPLVTCNQQQISQVLMNLLVNAAQAMVGQGKITVRSSSDTDMVYIAVSDTGCGIPESQLSRIFQPFYTTKEAGRGTGLGLSISHDIVIKHGGTIQVRSSVGAGATFTIALPLRRPENTTES